eukprot:m51a1_g7974 hypothetical protein (786) ;mRNA; f:36846-41020
MGHTAGTLLTQAALLLLCGGVCAGALLSLCERGNALDSYTPATHSSQQRAPLQIHSQAAAMRFSVVPGVPITTVCVMTYDRDCPATLQLRDEDPGAPGGVAREAYATAATSTASVSEAQWVDEGSWRHGWVAWNASGWQLVPRNRTVFLSIEYPDCRGSDGLVTGHIFEGAAGRNGQRLNMTLLPYGKAPVVAPSGAYLRLIQQSECAPGNPCEAGTAECGSHHYDGCGGYVGCGACGSGTTCFQNRSIAKCYTQGTLSSDPIPVRALPFTHAGTTGQAKDVPSENYCGLGKAMYYEATGDGAYWEVTVQSPDSGTTVRALGSGRQCLEPDRKLDHGFGIGTVKNGRYVLAVSSPRGSVVDYRLTIRSKCGNGDVDGTEECDGGQGCTSSCRCGEGSPCALDPYYYYNRVTCCHDCDALCAKCDRLEWRCSVCPDGLEPRGLGCSRCPNNTYNQGDYRCRLCPTCLECNPANGVCTSVRSGVSEGELLHQFKENGYGEKEFQEALNNALRQNSVGLAKKADGSILIKYIDPVEREKFKGLGSEEGLVLQTVVGAKNRGIWTKDIKMKTNLPQPTVQRALKTLEGRKLIKAVHSVVNKNKKLYMAYDVEPSREITGGAWYNESEFDQELINVLHDQCFSIVSHKGFASAEDVHKSVSETGIFKVALGVEEVRMCLVSLIYDGLVEEIRDPRAPSHENKVIYKPSRLGLIENPLTSIPCSRCPVARECRPDNVIAPSTCPYLRDWLDLPDSGLPADPDRDAADAAAAALPRAAAGGAAAVSRPHATV